MRRYTWIPALAVALTALGRAPAQVVAYSNVTNFSGNGFANGGATAASPITNLVADDVTMVAGAGGQLVTEFTFSVGNFDTTTYFSARPRIRIYADDGTGGGPGTVVAALTFNPITFTHGSVALFTTGVNSAGFFTAPADGNLWAGMTFDNVGATATVAQLNELGQGLFDPPTVGSSTDQFFITSSAGSFNQNNPPGTTGNNFGGSPVANFGWEFQVAQLAPVPEPGTFLM